MHKLLLLLLVVNSSWCHDHNHHGHSHDEPPSFKYSQAANEQVKPKIAPKIPTPPNENLWFYALGSTLLISAAPFFILFLVPLDNTDQEQPLLKVLLAFAAGGLLGDAFLHLIPHAAVAAAGAISGHGEHHHGHTHKSAAVGDGEEHHPHDMSVGLWVLAGIVTFLVVEKVVRILKGSHTHSHGAPHNSARPTNDKQKQDKVGDKKTNKKDKQTVKAEVKVKEKETPKVEIKVAGYLNLAADFCHNFTDGLAIGSSYLAGNTIGLVTTVTILLHEVPHEIGDFAILLQSGVSRRSAMLLQLTTALGAVAGTAIALFAQSDAGAETTAWILPFTAGGFIYIALVSVIPELLDEERPSLRQTIFQILAMLVGVGMMVVIAEFE